MSDSSLRMDGNIRVKVAKQYQGIYEALTNLAVGDAHELFFVCACIGIRMSRSVPLKKKAYDCFWSRTITPDEWDVYYAAYLHHHEMDISVLGDTKQMIDLAQDYANGGMAYLIEELLCDYVLQDESGKYIIDNSEGIPRELLMKIAMDWGPEN